MPIRLTQPFERVSCVAPRLLAAVASMLLASVLVAGTAVAAEETPAESAYRVRPNAAAAEQAARHWLDKGQVGRGMNWVERMVRSPGLTAAQNQWAAQMRADLTWRLADAGLGALTITVSPSDATVRVDGRELLPRTGQHVVWLQEGPHQVEASATDRPTSSQMVTVARGERRAVDLTLVAALPTTLVLDVEPACDVWIDGQRAGLSTQMQFAVSAGTHLVDLRLEGYHAWVRSIVVAAGTAARLTVRLERKAVDGQYVGPRASQVDRPLNDYERSQSGERGPDLVRGPQVDSPLQRQSGATAPAPAKPPQSAQQADPTPIQAVDAEPAAVSTEARIDALPPPPADAPAATVEAPAEPSAPWAATTKGWLLAVPGLAALVGGGAYAIASAQAAERVNQDFAYGDPDYPAAYATVAQRAYAGYGAMAAGTLLSGWGAAYLFGKEGLSRSGRGAVATVSGLATVGLAAYMWLGANQVLSSASDFEASHPEFDRRAALGARDSYIAYGIGAAGAALAGGGIYLWLTSGRGGGQSASAPASRGSWSVAPAAANGSPGATVSVTW